MLLEQLQEYLSLLLKAPEPAPLLGRDSETLARPRGLTVQPLGLLGDKVRVLLQLGDSQQPCFRESGRDHTVSVGMDRSRLQQWLCTGVDTSD